MRLSTLKAEFAARDRELAIPAGFTDLSSELPVLVRFGFGVLGWIAGMLLVGAVLAIISGALDSPAALGISGAAFIGAAFALYRSGRDASFAMQLALACSIAGQALLAAAIVVQLDPTSTQAWRLPLLLIALMQFALSAWIEQPTHRTMTAWFGVLALLGCLRLESIVNFSEVRPAQPLASLFELGLLVLVCELALRAPLRLSRLGQMLGGLLLGVLCLRFEDWLALGQGLVTGQTWGATLQHSLPLAIGWLYVVARLSWHTRQSTQAMVAIGITAVLIGSSCINSPGVLAALAVAVLSFYLRSTWTLVLSLVVGLVSIGAYYYQLQFTLTEKGGALLVLGGALLAAGYALKAGRKND